MVMHDQGEARDTAARFVARMDAGDWSDADEDLLRAWLDEDPMRQGLLLQLQAHWLALTPPSAEVRIEEEGEEQEGEAASPRWGRRGVLAGLAASTVLAFGIARWNQRPAEYATRMGEIRRLPLSDGSVMTINSGSNLTVTMANKAREVELSQGEAWFEVAKDARRPFVVAAGEVRVRAVGTAFSVRRRETGVEVQVTEGAVETWSDGERGPHMRLAAGDRAMISSHAVIDYETGIPSSLDRSLAWRSGMIDLNGRTLADAAEEFNRYNPRQIIIADPRIAREQLDGLFRVNDPEGFAEAVKASLGVAVDASDPELIRIKKSE